MKMLLSIAIAFSMFGTKITDRIQNRKTLQSLTVGAIATITSDRNTITVKTSDGYSINDLDLVWDCRVDHQVAIEDDLVIYITENHIQLEIEIKK